MDKIEIQNVCPNVFADFKELRSDVWKNDICFERGKAYLIEAASGTGKSTLCSYLLGFRHDYTGTITFDSHNIRSLGKKDWVNLRKNEMAMLFQELRLFPELTAFENVEIKNALTRHKSNAQIKEWFERIGLADRIYTPVAKMSFGQQQRVALLRALVCPFEFILLDEPTSHLDDDNSNIMAQLVLEEAEQRNAAIIVTSIGRHMKLDYYKTFNL